MNTTGMYSREEYVSISDFLPHIPVSRATIGKRIVLGKFPAPLPLPSRRRLWYRTEVSAWLRNNGLAPLPSVESGEQELSIRPPVPPFPPKKDPFDAYPQGERPPRPRRYGKGQA